MALVAPEDRVTRTWTHIYVVFEVVGCWLSHFNCLPLLLFRDCETFLFVVDANAAYCRMANEIIINLIIQYRNTIILQYC